MSEKTRESRLRRKAERKGLILRKSPRRDPDALDFGLYMLADPSTNCPLTPALESMRSPYGVDLDEIEARLNA